MALHSREGNAQFVSEQQSSRRWARAQLERLILTTERSHAPVTRAALRGARCISASAQRSGQSMELCGALSAAPDVRYRVTVYADRSIFGSGQPAGRPLRGVLTVRGCCVAAGL